MKALFNFILLISILNIYSQERKSLEAYRFNKAPKIDGLLSEDEWRNIKAAENFTLIMPETKAGEKIPDEYDSKVYFGFDDNALYIGAQLNHPDPKNIPSEFSPRDQIFGVKSEAFWISLDTYDDRLNHFGFIITSSGAIGDSFSSGEFSGESLNYDTVFDAKMNVNNDGWSVEFIIPYSAIRFPEKDIQNWGLNFGRSMPDLDDNGYAWNPVDSKVFEYHESMGLLKNLENIKPPTRLFFYPYLQSSVNAQKSSKSISSYSAGMDLKYGINNSFTLDMTLIPDFGQVSFDDRELNLSPFEQQFSEKRAFFTEGADLFEKADGIGYRSGNFFYSRRIGQDINFDEDDYLNENEELIRYDEKPDLINSIKVTGTTDGKLSIGFINAITGKAYAYFKDISDNSERRELISPLTNYNVLSLSQQLINDYSSISFLNTNVNRSSGLNGNSSALVIDLFDNKRNFNIKTHFFRSYAPRFSDKKGFRGAININELRGNFRFGLGWGGIDRYYNQNELGIFNLKNAQVFRSSVRYKMAKENKFLRSYNSLFFLNNRFRFHDFLRTGSGWRFSHDFQTQKLINFQIVFDYTGSNRDFYETRTEDRYVIEPANYGLEFGFNTNNNNTFSYGFEFESNGYNNKQFNENTYRNRLRFNAKYRVSNKLTFNFRSESEKKGDDVGFLQKRNNDIHFGKRLVKSIENSIDFTYNIDNYKYLALKFRNFWSVAKYDQVLYKLLENGLREIVDYSLLRNDPNTNFNLWNVDLTFDWWFSPGSRITLQYKNQIFNRDDKSALNYYKSLKNLFEVPIEHQLSLRVNYLIDFNKLRRND